jgi:hypothetical protein
MSIVTVKNPTYGQLPPTHSGLLPRKADKSSLFTSQSLFVLPMTVIHIFFSCFDLLSLAASFCNSKSGRLHGISLCNPPDQFVKLTCRELTPGSISLISADRD